MGNEINIKKLLCETFYKMFKSEALPNLDMDDFIAMWQTLADKWGINKSDEEWSDFAEEINSVASNRENYFNEIFDKHFNN
jgi:hypothetical protein